MKLISALMLLLLQTAACVDRLCRFNQSDSCDAAVGDTLTIIISHTRIYDVKIQKIIIDNTQHDPICRIRNNSIKMSECDLYNKTLDKVTVSNGALIINSVSTADSGTYRFSFSNSEGRDTSTVLQVNVEVCSVSMVFVLVWCLQMVLLLGLLGGFHLYMRHMSGNKEEDQELRVRRFREGPDDS